MKVRPLAAFMCVRHRTRACVDVRATCLTAQYYCSWTVHGLRTSERSDTSAATSDADPWQCGVELECVCEMIEECVPMLIQCCDVSGY